jgi:hypothetical protein
MIDRPDISSLSVEEIAGLLVESDTLGDKEFTMECFLEIQRRRAPDDIRRCAPEAI